MRCNKDEMVRRDGQKPTSLKDRKGDARHSEKIVRLKKITDRKENSNLKINQKIISNWKVDQKITDRKKKYKFQT